MPLSFTISLHPMAVADSAGRFLEMLQAHGAAMGLPSGSAPEDYRNRLDSIVTLNHDRLDLIEPACRSSLAKIISKNPADTIPLPLALPIIRIVAENLKEGRWIRDKSEAKRERLRAALDFIVPHVVGHFDVIAEGGDSQVCRSACRRTIEAMEDAHYGAFDFVERRLRKEGVSLPSQLTEEDQLLGTTAHLWIKRFQALVEEVPMRVECAYFDGEQFSDSFMVEVLPEFRNGRFVIGKIVPTSLKFTDRPDYIGVDPVNTPLQRLENDFGLKTGEPIPLDIKIRRTNP